MSETRRDEDIDRAGGRYRSVITYLEMLAPPGAPPPAPPRDNVQLARWSRPDLDDYLALYRRVGERWLWYGRLRATRDETERLLHSDAHEVWRLRVGADVAGLCELDRSRAREVEFAYFGLVPEYIGAGLGGFFLRSMVHEAWSDDVQRVWLHTCTEDHPDALAVYQRVGFVPWAEETEWVHDPRLRGLLPRTAGPHVPIPE